MSKNNFGRNQQNNQTSEDPLKLALEDAAAKQEVTEVTETTEATEAQAVEQVQATEASTSSEEALVSTPTVQTKVEAPVAAPVAAPVQSAPTRATQAVTSTVAPVTKKIARESTPTVVVTQVAETSSEFEVMMAKERKQGTISAQNLIAFLDKYVVNMKPKVPVTQLQVRQNQEGLVRTIRGLLNDSPLTEFNRLWNIMVAYFREYKKAAFSPMYVNRGPEEWKRAPEDYNFLVNMTNLLMATADMGKDAAKHVDLEKTTKSGFTDEAKGRLVAYYKT